MSNEKPMKPEREEKPKRPRKVTSSQPEGEIKPERTRKEVSPRPAREERTERPRRESTARPSREASGEKPWKDSSSRPDREERTERPRRESFPKPEHEGRTGRSWKDSPPRSEREGSAGHKGKDDPKPFGRSHPHKVYDDHDGKHDYKQRERQRDDHQWEQDDERPVHSGKRREFPANPGFQKKSSGKVTKKGDPELIRLNKFIANSGICSRREADKLIEAGAVSVNGKIVTELGTKISPADKVKFGDQTIGREKPQYLLLNKPKGFITTVDDPEKRKTVMALISGACKERVYPVGRLDRNTTGLLLFTNDGAIAKKLTHPRYGIKKIYHVEIEKPLSKADFTKIAEGFKLDDEFMKVDKIDYIGDGKDKKQIGLELHSGQNRVVRRIFEHFEHKVVKLDRVYYAGLTKKNLPRGHWRFLDEQEINMLKMISSKT